jgi:hypothetical protein
VLLLLLLLLLRLLLHLLPLLLYGASSGYAILLGQLASWHGCKHLRVEGRSRRLWQGPLQILPRGPRLQHPNDDQKQQHRNQHGCKLRAQAGGRQSANRAGTLPAQGNN